MKDVATSLRSHRERDCTFFPLCIKGAASKPRMRPSAEIRTKFAFIDNNNLYYPD